MKILSQCLSHVVDELLQICPSVQPNNPFFFTQTADNHKIGATSFVFFRGTDFQEVVCVVEFKHHFEILRGFVYVLIELLVFVTFMLGIAGVIPFAFLAVMMAFELFVALLQAYIFSVFSCVYINEALEGGH